MLYDRLTCDEHLELFGVAYGMDPRGGRHGRRESLYTTLAFDRWRASRVDELSSGTRAKLNLALALLADPDVLLLDEPYAGFDWETYLRLWDLTADHGPPQMMGGGTMPGRDRRLRCVRAGERCAAVISEISDLHNQRPPSEGLRHDHAPPTFPATGPRRLSRRPLASARVFGG